MLVNNNIKFGTLLQVRYLVFKSTYVIEINKIFSFIFDRIENIKCICTLYEACELWYNTMEAAGDFKCY